MASQRNNDQEESPLYLGLTILAVLTMLLGLVWLVASNKIVYASLSPGLFFGSMWKWFASDYTYSQWNVVANSVVKFAEKPSAVNPIQWGSFVVVAFRPVTFLFMLGYIALLVLLAFRPNLNLRRKITADSMLVDSMKHFTSIAPIVAIRKKIADDSHPLWRRQVTPEEIFLNYKVPRLAGDLPNGSQAKAGMLMMRDKKFDREVARSYFNGFKKKLPDGRMVSSMLGIQVVNLVKDAKAVKSKVFSDRMSAEGKALIALWAAVAFGGKDGVEDYVLYRDKLNLSAFGTKDGIANLSLIQPLYDKYRKNPLLNKLFAIHHWEHTVLFALLALAQKKGRYTTAEVLWLRPLNRIMFFSLNTRGAYTPHTESGSTFGMHAFEQACARANRLPMFASASGELFHQVYLDKVIDGLELEALRWMDADENDNEDWWQDKKFWDRSDPALKKLANMYSHLNAAVNNSVPLVSMPGVDSDKTSFDDIASDESLKSKEKNDAAFSDEFGAYLFKANGGKAGADDFN